MSAKKPKKLTNNQKAEARVEALLKRGIIIHARNAWGEYSIGPYRVGVGKPHFAIFAYGPSRQIPESHRHAEFQTAGDAASHAVTWLGSSNAREAAIKAEKKAAKTW